MLSYLRCKIALTGLWVCLVAEFMWCKGPKVSKGSRNVEHSLWLGASISALCISISPALRPCVPKAAVWQISHDMPTSETASDTWCNQEGSAELCYKCMRYIAVRVDRQSARWEPMVKVSWFSTQNSTSVKDTSLNGTWYKPLLQVIQRTWFLNCQLRSLI